MPKFKIHSEYTPQGDQPTAIETLVTGIEAGLKHQILLGATGTGKTFTMANVIERIQKPTLILAHNKTLAAQLYSEFKEFFPENAVEYFVSFYDYYQPEAYIAASDTYIEKDSAKNEEIDKLRHSATAALIERKDVIIVASVSCIYGLGDPEDYTKLMLSLRPGMVRDRNDVIRKLIEIQYTRNDIDFHRGTFRVRGDILEIYPAQSSGAIFRVDFFGDEIEKITEVDWLTGEFIAARTHIAIFPASHYATTHEKLRHAIGSIEAELEVRLKELKDADKLVEAQRLEQRTRYDIEMLQITGFCSGVENYSRHISGRAPGSAPFTLIDFFKDDFLVFADESHVSIPQIGGMYNGDRSRKEALVDYGFRLPSAFDNRPLKFHEFEGKVKQIVYVSATPSKYEYLHQQQIAEQIIRPTGLVDPVIHVRPVKGQIDDLIGEINARVAKTERVLVTTLTKRMAEDLTDYFKELGIKVRYLHSDVDTLERIQILRALRMGEFDVLVGINLLREGLDLPEVSLVAILDADKEGFLRSETSLIQTVGRAARNLNGIVIMYADKVTDSMKRAIDETNRRRTIQLKFNEDHGIVPFTVVKSIRDSIEGTKAGEDGANDPYGATAIKNRRERLMNFDFSNVNELQREIDRVTKEMLRAAKDLRFEEAAQFRDQLKTLTGEEM
ncbi:MAG: excinuclease ABC subunit UvrB [Clostridia bacterium]